MNHASKTLITGLSICIVAALYLFATACATMPRDIYVGVDANSADLDTYIEFDANILLITMNGEPIDRIGTFRLYTLPGTYSFKIAFYQETIVGSVKTIRRTDPMPLELTLSSGDKYAVIDSSESTDIFIPATVRIGGISIVDTKKAFPRTGVNPTTSVSFKDGKGAYYDFSGELKYFDFATGMATDVVKLKHGAVLATHVKADIAIAVYKNGYISIYELTTGNLLSERSIGFSLSAATIRDDAIYLCPESGGLISISRDGIELTNWTSPAGAFEITRRGRFLCATRIEGATIVNLESGEAIEFIAPKGKKLRQARVDSSAERLVVLYESRDFDVRAIKSIDAPITVKTSIPIGSSQVMAFDFSDDGSRFYIANFGNGWKLTTQVAVFEIGPYSEKRILYGPGPLHSHELQEFGYIPLPMKIFFDENTGDLAVLGGTDVLGLYPAICFLPGDPLLQETSKPQF